MESAYGVGVRNRYDLLIDTEGDPEEVVQIHEKQDKKKKKEHLNNVEVPSKDKLPSNKSKPFSKRIGKENQEKSDFEKSHKRVEDASQRGPSERTVRFANYTNPREERNNRRNRDDERTNVNMFPRETAPRLEGSERGRGRGMRGGRGRGRGRGRGFGQDGFDSRGKREFDRMSGSEKSSVRSFEKREGGGAHNWGKPTEVDATDVSFDMEGSFNNSDSKLDDSTEMIKDEVEKDGVTEEESSKNEIPEEPKEITFEEWKAQQGERQKPTFNIRKAGEGESVNWKKGCTVLTKNADLDSESEYEEDEEDWVPHGRQKQVVNINIEFSNPRKLGGRGRGRGGRGRGDGGGRGYNRGGKREDNKQSAPRVDDEKDFPCL